jgi:predicted PurR-regulated permease PerM
VQVPAPPKQVADWPVVGEKLEAAWNGAAANSEQLLKDSAPELARAGGWLLSTAAGFAFSVLQFAFALVLAGVFLATSAAGSRTAGSVAERLLAGRGTELVQISTSTIRSVAKGVIGVAFVQALMAWVGMAVAGVPASSTWALLVLILAIIQLPPAIVLGPVAFYVYSTGSTFAAVAFLVWTIIVSLSDTVLKPLFIGSGGSSPMLVILIGAIGGMMAFGILGLFIGAVVLAVGYELFMAWIRNAAVGGGESA